MMELHITTLNGDTQIVTVDPSATIGALKQQIAPLFNTGPSQIRLSTTNGQTLADHDQRMVRDCGLCSGATVMLLITNTPAPTQVIVKNEKGQPKTYDITEDETVNQLMVKIFQEEGVPVDQQRLIYNGRQLESNRKLRDYNIVFGSTIYMTLRLRGGCGTKRG